MRERLYRIQLEGTPWAEVSSYSDGMCGWVAYENFETTEYVAYHWSVTHPTCRSQEEARDVARRELTFT